MVFSKSIIYVLALIVFSLFAGNPQKNTSEAVKKLPSGEINIDSLRSIIKSNSWNKNLMEQYSNYLFNSRYDLRRELNSLKEFPESFQTHYLSSIVLKREGRYSEMFSELISVLKLNPDFIPYYDNLVFAASASDNISVLESEIVSNKTLTDKYKNYLSALINLHSGNYSAALVMLKKITTSDSLNKDILYQLSYTYRNLGNYVEALSAAENALRNAEGDQYFLTKTFIAVGSLYYLSGKYKSAEEYYMKANKLSQKINDKYDEAVSLVDLGIMLDQKGEILKAREYYSRAISIADDFNFTEAKALTHSELGVSYSYTNDLLNAKKNYLTSYNLYERLGNKLRLSLLSDNLARLYMNEFNYREAKNLYEKGLKYAGENKRARVINLTGLADLYANLSNYAKALEYYKSAQKISAGIKDIPLEAEISSGLGSLNFNLGNYRGAIRDYTKESTLCLQSGNSYLLPGAYHHLGLTYLEMDSLAQAENNLSNAYRLSKKYSDIYTQALSSIDLAYLFMEKGSYSKSLSLLSESEKISSAYGLKYLSALALLVEGKVSEKQNNFRKAKLMYESSLNSIQALNEPNIRIELYYSLAKLAEKNNNYREAESRYKEAIKIIERISRALYSKDEIQIAYFSDKDEVYNSLAELLLKEKRYEEALQVVDRSRSRNTIQNLFNIKFESVVKDKRALDDLYDYEWVINSGLYSTKQIDSVKEIYHSIILPLVSKYPFISDISDKNIADIPLNEIQQKLSDDEYLLSFFLTDKEMYIFLVSKNRFEPFVIDINKDELLKLISDISPYFKTSDNSERVFYNQDLFSFNARAAYRLYQKLLAKVLRDVPRNSKIIFSLSPELVTVPFEFLVDKKNNSESPYDYSNNNYLINDYQVSYTPSIELYLREKENDFKNDGKALVVGNPAINNQLTGFAERRGLLEETGGLPRNIALMPLKYSEDEVNEISSLIGADKILVERDATETNFKRFAEHSKIIHLSTHSFLLNKQPVIFLSNYYDPDNDGFLEANEIVQLKLNSDLVVLSSCNSGLGQIDQSEGIIGMTKAFYEAGAKSVIVSLWEVNDKYTSELMKLFYENLSSGMNKSEALRQAKIKFIKEYSANPFYWSAFILSGNTSGINLKNNPRVNPLLFSVAGIILMAAIVIFVKTSRNKIMSLIKNKN